MGWRFWKLLRGFRLYDVNEYQHKHYYDELFHCFSVASSNFLYSQLRVSSGLLRYSYYKKLYARPSAGL